MKECQLCQCSMLDDEGYTDNDGLLWNICDDCLNRLLSKNKDDEQDEIILDIDQGI